ncbi:MAG: tRNA (guanine(10)-N(2))-dimethyltransferase [DPANN group archaeon]|nr:tRNA (guanine(10)-N(2))-dimethyltransferase [DPANN group archaeon]
METITEGKITIEIPKGNIRKKDPVFYNPEMKLNRDISILAVKIFKDMAKRKITVADALSSSGIRTLRIAKECANIEKVMINDMNPTAIALAKKTAKDNDINNAEFSIEDANVFLSKNKNHLDYIDIDPFGSPIYFLDSCARAASGKSLIGVTATDTAPLSGTYPKTCIRRYGAVPLREDIKHEIGLRILIASIVRAFSRHNKSFVPLITYSKIHYFRIMGISTSSTSLAGKSAETVGYAHYCKNCGNRMLSKDIEDKTCAICNKDLTIAGPLWTGPINSPLFINKMIKENDFDDKKLTEFLELLKKESHITQPFYDLHQICKKNHLEIPKREKLFEELKNQGYKAEKTHHEPTGFKSDVEYEKLLEIIKKRLKK